MAAATRPRRITADRLPRLRAAAQLLHRPPGRRRPAEIAALVGGIQDQDQRAGRLAFRARDRRLRAADVDRARLEERSLLRCWSMRTTMHLVASEDADWLLPLFERRNGGFARRRLAQLGLAERRQRQALRLIEKWLADDGPLARPEMLERLRRNGLVPREEVKYHLWLLATTERIACFGPDSGQQTRLILYRDWLGEPGTHDRDTALAELARRYLRAFGPATARDMAKWSGLGLREVRLGLERIGREIEVVRVAGEDAWQLRRRRPRLPRRGWVRLLGDWDTYLLGHRDRDFIGGRESWSHIKRGGGGFLRPAVVADGVAVGSWRATRSEGAIEIEVTPFTRLDDPQLAAIDSEVEDVGRFEGLTPVLTGPQG